MQAPSYADLSHHQQTSEASFRILILKSTIKKCLPKPKKRGSTQVANRPKRKRIRTRRLIESASQGSDHDSEPWVDENVMCAPSDQSQDLDGYRPPPQIQAFATDGRLAGGQSRISQSHLCNTGMNSGTVRFTNIDFNNGLFDTGNHDTSQLG